MKPDEVGRPAWPGGDPPASALPGKTSETPAPEADGASSQGGCGETGSPQQEIEGAVTFCRWFDLRFASALYRDRDSAQEEFELTGDAEVRGKPVRFRHTLARFAGHDEMSLDLGEAETWVTVSEYKRLQTALHQLALQLGAILKSRSAVIAEEGFDRDYRTGAYVSTRPRPFRA